MLLPIRSKNPPESFPFVTCILIALNVMVYVFTTDGVRIHPDALHKLALTGENFSVGTVFSSMFLHANIEHLLGNMWFLYLFGFAVEGRLRWWKFAITYLGAGTTGALLHELVIGQAHPTMPMLGASGAIMGVLGAALYMFPYAQVDFFWFTIWRLARGYSIITPWSMWVVGLFYIGIDLMLAWLFGNRAIGGVAHFVHVGGALGGFLLCMGFRPKRDSQMASEAKAVYADTKDLSLAHRMELEEIARSNPDDPHVVLTWMHQCVRDNRINPVCRESFFRLMPRMLKEQPPASIGSCLLMLNDPPGSLQSRLLLEVASGCERTNEPAMAIKLYETAWQCDSITPQEQETALFRVAMLCERSLLNFPRAIATYQEVINRFPMSPLADQARVRLKALTPKAP